MHSTPYPILPTQPTAPSLTSSHHLPPPHSQFKACSPDWLAPWQASLCSPWPGGSHLSHQEGCGGKSPITLIGTSCRTRLSPMTPSTPSQALSLAGRIQGKTTWAPTPLTTPPGPQSPAGPFRVSPSRVVVHPLHGHPVPQQAKWRSSKSISPGRMTGGGDGEGQRIWFLTTGCTGKETFPAAGKTGPYKE